MKLLGVLLQTKKGDPLIISSSPALHTRTIILYSNLIYANILDSRRQKVERCIVLESNLQCVLNIAKDYIFYVYVSKSELGLAFDAVKKVADFFNNNSLRIFENAKTGQAKLEIVNKRFVEFMSFFEQFLYTRQFPIGREREIFSLSAATQSTKKKIDFEIFNKFSHINQENDKIIILQMSRTSNKVAGLQVMHLLTGFRQKWQQHTQVKKKMKIIEHMKKYSIKNKDELELLDKADPQKEDFISSYKKNLARFAYCGKAPNRNALYQERQTSSTMLPRSENNFIIQEEMLDESPRPVVEKEKIKVKMMEKLQLHLFQGKIKQVIQFGQVIVQGAQVQTAKINLIDKDNLWTNNKVLNKRISPNSLKIKQLTSSKYEFTTVQDYKSKPLIDYIIRKQSFTPEKIPLLFVYTMQTHATNIEFIFKYKINEKWKQPLTDIEIAVHLNPEFLIREEVKSIPMAVSLKNHKIIWKTKEISHTTSSKGKILLAFTNSNVPPKSIIKQIRLNMKCQNKGMLQSLNVECQQQDGHIGQPQKVLIIHYKVHPNQ